MDWRMRETKVTTERTPATRRYGGGGGLGYIKVNGCGCRAVGTPSPELHNPGKRALENKKGAYDNVHQPAHGRSPTPRGDPSLKCPRRCTPHVNHPMHHLAQSSLCSSLPFAEEQQTAKEGTSLAQGHGTKCRAAIRPHSQDGPLAAPGHSQALGAALDGSPQPRGWALTTRARGN